MFASPLDLLTNSADEQTIIRCLIRTPRISREELATQTKIPLNQLETLLDKLLVNTKVVQHGQNGHATFSAQFAPAQRTNTSGLLDSLFV